MAWWTMIRGVRVELPAAAAQKLNLLSVAAMVAEDAVRAVSSRLSNLPRDAEVRPQLEHERVRHSARHQAISALVHKLNEFLMKLPANAALEVVPAEIIELRDGAALTSAIEDVRREIAALQGQAQVIKNAPLPLADQRQAVAAYVERLAQTAVPFASVVQNGTLRIGFKDVLIEPEQTLALLAWVDPEKVTAALTGLLESAPRVVGAMPASERQQRLAELEDKLLALERAEESMIERAAKLGIDVLRRPTADPRSVLGIAVVAKAKVAAQAQVVA
jgi:hypothetical protein